MSQLYYYAVKFSINRYFSLRNYFNKDFSSKISNTSIFSVCQDEYDFEDFVREKNTEDEILYKKKIKNEVFLQNTCKINIKNFDIDQEEFNLLIFNECVLPKIINSMEYYLSKDISNYILNYNDNSEIIDDLYKNLNHLKVINIFNEIYVGFISNDEEIQTEHLMFSSFLEKSKKELKVNRYNIKQCNGEEYTVYYDDKLEDICTECNKLSFRDI